MNVNGIDRILAEAVYDESRNENNYLMQKYSSRFIYILLLLIIMHIICIAPYGCNFRGQIVVG